MALLDCSGFEHMRSFVVSPEAGQAVFVTSYLLSPPPIYRSKSTLRGVGGLQYAVAADQLRISYILSIIYHEQ